MLMFNETMIDGLNPCEHGQLGRYTHVVTLNNKLPHGFAASDHKKRKSYHYCDVIMGAMVSQITSLTIVYSTVYSGTDQRKHQSSASLAFVWEIHRWPVNSRHKWPLTRKMFPFDDVIMRCATRCIIVKTLLAMYHKTVFICDDGWLIMCK